MRLLRVLAAASVAVVILGAAMASQARAEVIPTTGLELWLKADAITGVADGGAVATWVDSSGNLHDLTQANPSYQPTYQAGVLNGQPVVRFGGVDDFLTREALTLDEQHLTAYAVFKINGTAGASTTWNGAPNPTPGVNAWPHNAIFNSGDTNNPGNTQISLFDSYDVTPGTDLYYDSYPPSGGSLQMGSVGTTNFNVVEVILDNTGGLRARTGYIDGQSMASDNLSEDYTGLAPASFDVGTMDPANLNHMLNGDIAELLIYSRPLSGAEQSQVNSYLGSKYGIAVPEPGTFILLLGIALGIFCVRRFRR